MNTPDEKFNITATEISAPIENQNKQNDNQNKQNDNQNMPNKGVVPFIIKCNPDVKYILLNTVGASVKVDHEYTNKIAQVVPVKVPIKKPRKNRVVLNSQAKQIVYNFYQYIKEKKKKQEDVSLDNLYETVSEALKISHTTVSRIVREGRSKPEDAPFHDPVTNRQPRKKKPLLSEYEEDLVRNITRNFIMAEKHPTFKQIYQEIVNNHVQIKCKLSSFCTYLKGLGFSCTRKKTKTVWYENNKPVIETDLE